MTDVWESPHTGAILDIGAKRVTLEHEAHKKGLSSFSDEIDGWPDLLAGQLSLTQLGSSTADLDHRLVTLGAYVVAWIEDIRTIKSASAA